MPANLNAFKNNIKKYLDDQSASDEQAAADFLSAECAKVLNAASDAKAGNPGTTPPSICAAQFKAAFDSVKATGVNTPANWAPVAATWGADLTAKAWLPLPPAGVVAFLGGAAGVPAASVKLAQAFSKSEKSSNKVADDIKKAMKACVDGATGTYTTPTGVTTPIVGLS